MAEDIRMWEIKGEKIEEIGKSQFKSEHKEIDLEDWIENDITLISKDLLIIGRQVRTYKPNADIDLLCLDKNGDVVIIEIKRDKTPREVTAQTLDYASWIKDLSYDDIVSKANEYLNKKKQSLEDAFLSKFDNDLPEELNLGHRMLIVASELDNETERIIKYLSEEYDVPINFVKFQYFRKKENEQEFLARVFLLDPVETEQRASIRGKRKKVALTDPIELFNTGMIKEEDVFFFRDNEDILHKDIECQIVKERGRASSFIVKIDELKGHDKIDIPESYLPCGIEYKEEKFPVKVTTRTLSIALHHLRTYKDRKIDVKEYYSFGNTNFERKKDEKGLDELCKEYRNSN